MSWVWDNATVEGTALLMLLAIADHANDDGVCWPSIGTLASKARVGERQAQRLVAALEESGAIEIERGVGRRHTSIYRIKGVTHVTNSAKEKVSHVSPISQRKGDIQREKVTSSALKGDIAMSPEPLEPSLTTTITARAARVAKTRTPARPQSPPPPAIEIYENICRRKPNKEQHNLILQSVTDCTHWRAVLTLWMQKGHRPDNVVDQLDVYAHGWKQKGHQNGKHGNRNRTVDADEDDWGFQWPDGVWRGVPFDSERPDHRRLVEAPT